MVLATKANDLLDSQQTQLDQAAEQIKNLQSLLNLIEENKEIFNLLEQSLKELKAKEQEIKELKDKFKTEYTKFIPVLIHFAEDLGITAALEDLTVGEDTSSSDSDQSEYLEEQENPLVEVVTPDIAETDSSTGNEEFIEETAELIGALTVAPVIERAIESEIEELEPSDELNVSAESEDTEDSNEYKVLSKEEAEAKFFNGEWFFVGHQWQNLEIEIEQEDSHVQCFFPTKPDILYHLEMKEEGDKWLYRRAK